MGADEVTRRMLATYEAGDLVAMCAWCRRVEVDGEWFRAACGSPKSMRTLTH
jgi:hypothetical protein